MPTLPARTGPLVGLKVLEIGHYVAAPFCTRILADLGAEVIKIEPPGGDPFRGWGAAVDGNSVWFSIHGRNKLSVVLDLKRERETALKLAAQADVLVENLRAGQLERLGLGPAELHGVNPRLVIARISGYGQDGPYRDRPAFGAIGEAMGGLRHLTGHPPGVSDLPPPRCGISISDDLAGMYAAIGLLAALWQRDAGGGTGGGTIGGGTVGGGAVGGGTVGGGTVGGGTVGGGTVTGDWARAGGGCEPGRLGVQPAGGDVAGIRDGRPGASAGGRSDSDRGADQYLSLR